MKLFPGSRGHLAPRPFVSSLVLLVGCLMGAACGDDTTTGGGGAGGAPSAGGGEGGGQAGGPAGGGGEGPGPDPAFCEDRSLPTLPWSEGPYGSHRGELAGDFELALVPGTSWKLSHWFTGCESYVFLPDTLTVSETDDTSIWERDLDKLVAESGPNVHYFFFSRRTSEATVKESVEAMQARIDSLLTTLPEADKLHWQEHLHVLAKSAQGLEGWLKDVANGIGRAGFAIDRAQKIRGVGFLADVKRYSGALANGGHWPWRSNLAYAAKEAHYFDAQELVRARLADEQATVVSLWTGEVLSQFEEKDVELPSAQEMAGFDTLEIDIESACPDPELIEFGNCGAWDYLASFYVRGEDDTNIELARFITSYHRETYWVVDASPMLGLLKDGGTRHFRWEFAPEWNVQPTATKLSLRFSNRGKGYRPTQVIPLWKGGPFNAAYNEAHPPMDVPIPQTATRVELVSLVTGHGAAQSQCSEFCNHQHELTIGETSFLKEFPEAGTEDLCVPQLEHGMVPNQGGTWWFGRGGWCPGQQVTPWIEDVSDLVTPGETATIRYRGLFDDTDPPDDSGDISLSSYLVVYE